MKQIVLALVAFSILSVHAQDVAPPAKFTTAEAGEHIGETVTICGVVADSRYLSGTARSPTFLNFDSPFPRHTCTAVILGENRAKFSESPETYYKGKKICVTGLLRISHGRPEIELTEASQVSVEEMATAETASAEVAAPETTPAPEPVESK